MLARWLTKMGRWAPISDILSIQPCNRAAKANCGSAVKV
jgi:hypothetical protein